MLTISKTAEFGADNLAVRGQCQPHHRNWQLRLVVGSNSETLHEDSYYNCRRIQQECRGEMSEDAVRSKVKEVALSFLQDVEETQCIPARRGTDIIPKSSESPTDRLRAIPDRGAMRDQKTEIMPRQEKELEKKPESKQKRAEMETVSFEEAETADEDPPETDAPQDERATVSFEEAEEMTRNVQAAKDERATVSFEEAEAMTQNAQDERGTVSWDEAEEIAKEASERKEKQSGDNPDT